MIRAKKKFPAMLFRLEIDLCTTVLTMVESQGSVLTVNVLSEFARRIKGMDIIKSSFRPAKTPAELALVKVFKDKQREALVQLEKAIAAKG